MTTTRLGRMLLPFVALAAILSAHSANAARADPTDYGPPATDANGAIYCVSDYIASQNPGCVPPPAATETYQGQPVSVGDRKDVQWGTMRASVNVLKNDAIENRSKIREIDIVGQRPKLTGLRSWVYKNKIWFEMLNGQHLGYLSGGLGNIQYRVIDNKGRASYPVGIAIKIK